MSYEKPVEILDNFLDPSACSYLISKYGSLCQKSTTITANGINTNDPARTSYTYYLPDNDAIIKQLKAAAASYVSSPIENVEGLQLVRYEKGQQFTPHFDYFTFPTKSQRIHTLLVYLNDIELKDGGATLFITQKLRVYPKTGRAIYFRDASDTGIVDPRSLHSGEPILGDTIKYAINIWIRNTKWP